MHPPSSLVARSSLLRGGARSALPSAATTTTTTTTTCRPTSSHLASNATAHDNVRDRRRSLGHRDATTTTTTIASLLAATAGGGALVREAADRRDGSGAAAGGGAEAVPCLCEPSKIGVATRRLTNRPGTIEVDAKRRMTTRRRMTRRRREEETLGKESVVEARRESLAGDDIALSTPPSLVHRPMHDLVAGGIAGSVSVVVGRE
jgi:hypothetical protein